MEKINEKENIEKMKWIEKIGGIGIAKKIRKTDGGEVMGENAKTKENKDGGEIMETEKAETRKKTKEMENFTGMERNGKKEEKKIKKIEEVGGMAETEKTETNQKIGGGEGSEKKKKKKKLKGIKGVEGTKKTRIEIICSQAIDEDFLDEFKKAGVGKFYTKMQSVMGVGFSKPRLGNEVWPQLNVMYVIYCDKTEAEKIIGIVKKLRKLFATEGIACFVASGKEV